MLVFLVIMSPRKRKDLDEMPALQVLREAAGLSQAELAKRIPDRSGQKTTTQQAISRWERGIDQPQLTVAQMKALCRALNVSLEQLPDDFGPPKRSPSHTSDTEEED